MAYVSQKKIMFQSLIGTVQPVLSDWIMENEPDILFQSLIGTVQQMERLQKKFGKML